MTTRRTMEIRIRVTPETRERFNYVVGQIISHYGLSKKTSLEDILNIILSLALEKLSEKNASLLVD